MAHHKDDVLTVACAVFPDGTVRWIELPEDRDLTVQCVGAQVSSWKAALGDADRARLTAPGVSGGFCIVFMPRADFDHIPAPQRIPYEVTH